MTLPRHTITKKDEVQPVVEGALRCVRAWEALLPVPQTEFPPQAWDLVEHEEGVYS